jgi:hypothetical protein
MRPIAKVLPIDGLKLQLHSSTGSWCNCFFYNISLFHRTRCQSSAIVSGAGFQTSHWSPDVT